MQVKNFITTAMNNGMFCLGVFIDLRKAFDVCSHKILLKKLKSLGEQGCLAKNKNLNELIIYVNLELQKIANWFLSNKMAINTSKTKFILFRTQGKKVDDQICKIVFNNNKIGKFQDPLLIFPIERIHNQGVTKVFKLLGVLLDEYLSFDAHINLLCSKISKSSYIINRAKNFLPKYALLSLYYALIHSHLAYFTSIYGNANQTNIQKLAKIQKKAIRVISNASFRAHTAPLFKKLQILPVEQMITYSKLKFMHNFTFNRLPPSFQGMLSRNIDRDPAYNLRNAENFFITPIKFMPLFSFPALWNNENVSKEDPNSKSYLRSLKSRLLREI